MTMRAIFVLRNKKITYNIKPTGQILMHVHTLTYVSRFYELNKSGHMRP